MRFSREHKAETHARIVDRAAELIRRDGVAGVSVPGLMKEAGLTHGGFYAHFASKDALVAEAVAHAADTAFEQFSQWASGSDDPLGAVIDHYVSAQHRDHPEKGCPIAALGADAARSDGEAAGAMASGAKRSVERAGEALKAIGKDEDDAIALYAKIVGAVVLSRACAADPEFSDRVLEVCRKRFKAE